MQLLREIKDKPFPKNEKVGFRQASRAILFDNNNLVPILFVSKENYEGGFIQKRDLTLLKKAREIINNK